MTKSVDVSKAIMDDYQNDTCVGKYLKRKDSIKEEYQKEATEKEEPLAWSYKIIWGSISYGFSRIKRQNYIWHEWLWWEYDFN